MPIDAKDVIDRAIEQNKPWESLLYAYCTAIFVVGIVAILVGVISGNEWSTIAGVIGEGLFLPGAYMARGIYNRNIAVRLLELIVREDTPPEDVVTAITSMLHERGKDQAVKKD